MMSPFKIILKPNLQYIPDFENPKNQKGHVISDSFLSDGGSDIAKGVRLLLESSTFNGFQALDIGHFCANLLKKNI